MNNQLSIIIFWILALSCKAPVSSLYQDKVSLLSAEKTDWTGGRPGVRGTVYTVKLKLKSDKDPITVKSLKAEGKTVNFSQNISRDILTVRGHITVTPQQNNLGDTPSEPSAGNSRKPSDINMKNNWIEFITKNSKKTYKISIPEFVPVETAEELIPQQR